MKKTLLTLLTLGMFSCDFLFSPSLQKPNTEVITPIQRNDLSMSIELSNYGVNEAIDYTAKLQNISNNEIKLDNSIPRNKAGTYLYDQANHCIEFKIMQGNQEVVREVNESDMIIWLKSKGYIETQAKQDTFKTKVCNAKLNYWGSTYDVPFPLAITKTSLKQPLRLPAGKYNFEALIKYSINDSSYNTTFVSEPFNVGINTSISLLKMGRNRYKEEK